MNRHEPGSSAGAQSLRSPHSSAPAAPLLPAASRVTPAQAAVSSYHSTSAPNPPSMVWTAFVAQVAAVEPLVSHSTSSPSPPTRSSSPSPPITSSGCGAESCRSQTHSATLPCTATSEWRAARRGFGGSSTGCVRSPLLGASQSTASSPSTRRGHQHHQRPRALRTVRPLAQRLTQPAKGTVTSQLVAEGDKQQGAVEQRRQHCRAHRVIDTSSPAVNQSPRAFQGRRPPVTASVAVVRIEDSQPDHPASDQAKRVPPTTFV